MNTFHWIAVAAVVVLSSARLTRLATVDKFPPAQWLRNWYEVKTDGSDWQLLTMCGYCFSFWATIPVVLAGYYSDWHEVWWIVNGIFGASYVAAIVMAFDGDEGDD